MIFFATGGIPAFLWRGTAVPKARGVCASEYKVLSKTQLQGDPRQRIFQSEMSRSLWCLSCQSSGEGGWPDSLPPSLGPHTPSYLSLQQWPRLLLATKEVNPCGWLAPRAAVSEQPPAPPLAATAHVSTPPPLPGEFCICSCPLARLAVSACHPGIVFGQRNRSAGR